MGYDIYIEEVKIKTLHHISDFYKDLKSISFFNTNSSCRLLEKVLKLDYEITKKCITDNHYAITPVNIKRIIKLFKDIKKLVIKKPDINLDDYVGLKDLVLNDNDFTNLINDLKYLSKKYKNKKNIYLYFDS